MSANSKIEWTDHTFNPWIGCTKISTAATGGGGCDGCYAEVSTPARVLRSRGSETWGPHAPRVRTSAANWSMPRRWNEQAGAFMAQHGRRQRVFCASLADVFDNAVDPQWRADLFALIQSTPALDWLLLTKRIGNVRAMLPEAVSGGELPSNVWLGATIVNQAEADRDIPKLLATPAAVRFLSMEPLLGPVDLAAHIAPPPLPFLRSGTPLCNDLPCNVGCARKGRPHYPGEYGCRWSKINNGGSLPTLDWVIVGGESGPSARPMHPDWASSLRDQCQAAGVPFLFKQWGEWLPINQQAEEFTNRLYRSNRRARPHEDQGALDDCHGRTCLVEQAVIQNDGTVHAPLAPMAFRQGTGAMLTFKAGKKAAARLLDGCIWDQFPEEGCHGAT